MSKFRKIIVDDMEFQYKVGRANVVIRKDDKKFAVINFSDLTGQDWNSIERDNWDGNFHITPTDIYMHIASILDRDT